MAKEIKTKQSYLLIGAGVIILLLIGVIIFQNTQKTIEYTTMQGNGKNNNSGMGAGMRNNQARIDEEQWMGQGNKASINEETCLADDCLAVEELEYPAGTLPESVKNALDEAINDEYKALSTYEVVISKFGMVRPFSMIKGAEEQHIASLKAIYDKYGLEVPRNEWSGSVAAPSTLQEACQTGVDAEIANASLYRDKLLPAVSDFQDITIVFTNLMNASQEKHLPAFDRCN